MRTEFLGMKPVCAGLVMLFALTACAAQQWTYAKAGATEADRKRDQTECARAALSDYTPARVLGAFKIDRDAFIKCLEDRGYTVRRG